MVLSLSSRNLQTTNESTIKLVDDSKSLFIEALDMLRENDRFFNETLRRAHTNVILAESSERDKTYITEFSIIDTIKSIIGFFVDLIKTIFGKFKSMFQKVIFSDKTIENNKEKIRNMKGEFTLNFTRYNFTCFDANIPSIDLKNTFYEDYRILEGKLESLADLKTKSERCERMRAIEADIKDDVSPAYYDTLRQKSIGAKYMISSTDYASELFKVFRDGGEQANGKVNNTEINNVLNRYLANKTTLKDTEKMKDETIRSAKEIQKKIEHISLHKSNSFYVPYDVEEEALFTKILQRKSGQVSEACNIFVMAFSAKLDAIKEAAKQDKKILLEAVKFINMGGGE